MRSIPASARIATSTRIARGPAPGEVYWTTTFENLDTATVHLPTEICGYVLRAHRRADFGDRPRWESPPWPHPLFAPGSRRPELDASIHPILRPGKPRHMPHFGWNGHVLGILGDSLPEGRYHFQAELHFATDTLRIGAGSLHLQRATSNTRQQGSRSGRGVAAPGPRSSQSDTAGAYTLQELTDPPLLLNRLEMLHQYGRLYPPTLLEVNVGGQTIVQIVIDEKGVPIHSEVIASSRPEFNAPSIELGRLLRFRPGLCGKEPVRIRFDLPIGWAPESARRPPPLSLAPEPQEAWRHDPTDRINGIRCTRSPAAR